jgi:hypothetical protein
MRLNIYSLKMIIFSVRTSFFANINLSFLLNKLFLFLILLYISKLKYELLLYLPCYFIKDTSVSQSVCRNTLVCHQISQIHQHFYEEKN